ncbi:type II toxin-antitoxin system PemK/MazF family toxin [Streptomyces sp. NP-1717]|uniref:type II toxin-antitoxin system PemK/MazF family toxin n=1 Tax=unclassified Streptomyces TaxID=2593676 RepID=UPI001F5D2674|nr:type II toxin-antitoxin system PemK/MazF family toxin [Streptomyces sp. NP-1717]MCI3222822.1 type II toxin-antitoxin system PemK/MazF family toxin [Streptomyces sp. NP-1717]WTA73572.1 type II toxin-antitoxin system PemK/MazF family toxin [Streptomyces sp. NBC_00838]
MNTTWWVALIVVVVLAMVATVVDGRGRSPRPPRGRTRRTRPPGGTDRRPPRGPAGRRTGAKTGAKTGAETGGRTGGREPRPGEIWWAMVPYEDGPGAKDRPCLVLSVRGRTVLVAKITSKFHEERPGVIPLPPKAVGDLDGRQSFLETDELRSVDTKAFRRCVGQADPGLWRQVRHLAR